MTKQSSIKRRTFLKAVCGMGGLALFSRRLLSKTLVKIQRAIPSSGEKLAVIGMGSSRTFDVNLDATTRKALSGVLQAFFKHGGTLIDSSPMYGTAEKVLGDLLASIDIKQAMFAATKVWTYGEQAGIEQMQQSMQRMNVKAFDLMQIHNLRDWKVHLKTLMDWKQKGKIRYIGITTSHQRFHEQFETIMKKEKLDFVQFSYNIGNRVAEQRLLPIAADRGIAVIINRPYQRGALFRGVKGKALPDFAKEFDCSSWGQFFLKFIVSHPAVSCVIPATSKTHHMVDNMAAGMGRLPDATMRKSMLQYFKSL